MSPLTQEQLDHFRGLISGLDMSDARKDELIQIIDNIAVSFVDQAFGLDPTQLSLSARANFSFLGFSEYGRKLAVEKQEITGLLIGGVITETTPESP